MLGMDISWLAIFIQRGRKMDKNMKMKVIKLSLTILGYMVALFFLIAFVVYLLIYLWLPSILFLSLSLFLFFFISYFYTGTSIYVIYGDSIYVPRLYRYGDAKKKEILDFHDVKKVREIKTFLKDGYFLYTTSGYYYIKRDVFTEIRENLPENVAIEKSPE